MYELLLKMHKIHYDLSLDWHFEPKNEYTLVDFLTYLPDVIMVGLLNLMVKTYNQVKKLKIVIARKPT